AQAGVLRAVHVAEAVDLEELMRNVDEVLVDDGLGCCRTLPAQPSVDRLVPGGRRTPDQQEEHLASPALACQIVEKVDESGVLQRPLRDGVLPRWEEEGDLAGALLVRQLLEHLQSLLRGLEVLGLRALKLLVIPGLRGLKLLSVPPLLGL